MYWTPLWDTKWGPLHFLRMLVQRKFQTEPRAEWSRFPARATVSSRRRFCRNRTGGFEKSAACFWTQHQPRDRQIRFA